MVVIDTRQAEGVRVEPSGVSGGGPSSRSRRSPARRPARAVVTVAATRCRAMAASSSSARSRSTAT